MIPTLRTVLEVAVRSVAKTTTTKVQRARTLAKTWAPRLPILLRLLREGTPTDFMEYLCQDLECEGIPGHHGDAYLSKYLLFRRGEWALRVHRFHRPDVDQELHNHPWSVGLSLILFGGYEEECWRFGRVRVTSTYRPGDFNLLFATTFHRVSRLFAPDSWSLFLSGPLTQSWGFLDDASGQLYPWRDFLAKKASTDQTRRPPRPPKH